MKLAVVIIIVAAIVIMLTGGQQHIFRTTTESAAVEESTTGSSSIRDLTRYLSRAENKIDLLPDDYASQIVPLHVHQKLYTNPNLTGSVQEPGEMCTIHDEYDHPPLEPTPGSPQRWTDSLAPYAYRHVYVNPFGVDIPEHLHEGLYGSMGSHFQISPEIYEEYREMRSKPSEYDSSLDDLSTYIYGPYDNKYAFPYRSTDGTRLTRTTKSAMGNAINRRRSEKQRLKRRLEEQEAATIEREMRDRVTQRMARERDHHQ